MSKAANVQSWILKLTTFCIGSRKGKKLRNNCNISPSNFTILTRNAFLNIWIFPDISRNFYNKAKLWKKVWPTYFSKSYYRNFLSESYALYMAKYIKNISRIGWYIILVKENRILFFTCSTGPNCIVLPSCAKIHWTKLDFAVHGCWQSYATGAMVYARPSRHIQSILWSFDRRKSTHSQRWANINRKLHLFSKEPLRRR